MHKINFGKREQDIPKSNQSKPKINIQMLIIIVLLFINDEYIFY